jgi:hypothetical protein
MFSLQPEISKMLFILKLNKSYRSYNCDLERLI